MIATPHCGERLVRSEMLHGYHPVSQSLMGTFLTWGLTAAGAALVFVFQGGQRKVLDGSLGFAAGVMLAASYWSLLAPAIELAEQSGMYGPLTFLPVSVGFIAGAAFVYLADVLLPLLGVRSSNWAVEVQNLETKTSTQRRRQWRHDSMNDAEEGDVLEEGVRSSNWAVEAQNFETKTSTQRRRQWRHDSMSDAEEREMFWRRYSELAIRGTNPLHREREKQQGDGVEELVDSLDLAPRDSLRRRRSPSAESADLRHQRELEKRQSESYDTSWRRILLLIIAITVHNIPEGLAVGVGFGAIGKSPSATLESARNLALGIGIQNFPEGLAVSLPLKAAGMGTWKSFWYGQLSGMVEPLAGLFGAIAVVVAEPLLPYALAFAAGAMVFVVMDDILPEAHSCGNGRLSSVAVIVGFIVMMSLDVGFG